MAGTTGDAFRGFDRWIDRLFKQWKVPGAAVAVVQDGEPVLVRGYGRRDVVNDLPVTEHTRFTLASVTKAFTALSVALLVDDGLLDWDRPVRDYLAWFRLHDDFATARITARDLLTHRSGLPRHDALWYRAALERREAVERLRYLQPTKDLRTTYQYNNLMYMTAGLLVETIAGRSWEELVRERILEPLGMTESGFAPGGGPGVEDRALPYKRAGNRYVQLPLYDAEAAVAPMGGIVSTATDVARWIQLHLGHGEIGGRRIVSRALIDQLHMPHIPVTGLARWPEMPYSSYAMGWTVQPYRGAPRLQHTGNLDGFSTMAVFLPQHDAGVAVLTNMDVTPVREIIAFNVTDRLLGLEPIDWSGRLERDYEVIDLAVERGKERAKRLRVRNTRPSRPLKQYAGTYGHPAYGAFTVEVAGNRLSARFREVELTMKHVQYDTWTVKNDLLDLSWVVTFIPDSRGGIGAVEAPLEPAVPDIVFRRVPDASASEPELLRRLVGTYDWMGYSVSITFKGERALEVWAPDLRGYELEPVDGLRYALKGLSRYEIEFVLGADGRAEALLLVLDGAEHTAPRKDR